MQRITFVPGAVASPAAITIPVPVPDIDLVLAAVITRLPTALAVPDHLAAAIQASAPISDHVVHSHPFALSAGGAGGTLIAGAALLSLSAGAQLVDAGGAAGDGVRNNAAAQAHAFGAGVATVHGANVGATPVVAAVATKLTTRTISLSVNTVLGDLLTLDYIETGARVPVS